MSGPDDLRRVFPNTAAEGTSGAGTSRPTVADIAVIEAKSTLTIAEAMVLTGRCRETLRRAIRGGDLRAARWGNRVVIRRRDLEAFMDALPSAEGDAA